MKQKEIHFEVQRCQDIGCLEEWEGKPLPLQIMIESNSNNLEANERIAKTALKKVDFMINSSFSKRSILNLIALQCKTTTGLFFDSYGFTGLVFHRQISELMDMNPILKLGEVILRLDQVDRIFVNRELYQFRNLISFVGGLLKGVTLLVFIFVYPVREISFYSGLVNEIFRVCDNPDKLKKMVYVGPVTKIVSSSRNIEDDPQKGENDANINEV